MSKKHAASTIGTYPSLPKKGGPGTGSCLCGCGGSTKSRFVPGHDGHLLAIVLRIEKDVLSLDKVPAGERRSVEVEIALRKKAKPSLTGLSHTRALITAEELAKAPKAKVARKVVAKRPTRRKVATVIPAVASEADVLPATE